MSDIEDDIVFLFFIKPFPHLWAVTKLFFAQKKKQSTSKVRIRFWYDHRIRIRYSTNMDWSYGGGLGFGSGYLQSDPVIEFH